jgi:hypothetical protein
MPHAHVLIANSYAHAVPTDQDTRITLVHAVQESCCSCSLYLLKAGNARSHAAAAAPRVQQSHIRNCRGRACLSVCEVKTGRQYTAAL